MTATEIFLTVGDEDDEEKEEDGKNAEEEKNEQKDEKNEEVGEKVEKRKRKGEGEALRKSPRKQASRASKPKYSLV